MIKKFRVKNFKAFRDTGDIELKPMTVIAGPNSSGKTTILQSLLLLKQTLENKNPGVELDLNGEFMQLTSLTELAFGKPPSQKCRIVYSFTLETEIPAKYAREYFPNLAVSEENLRLRILSDVGFSFRYRRDPGEKQRIQVAAFDMQTRLKDLVGPRFSFGYTSKGVTARLEGAGVDTVQSGRNGKILEVSGRHFMPSLLKLERPGKLPDEQARIASIWLPPIFHVPLRELATDLERNMRYLGPLREEPKPAYLHSGTSSPEIGKRGEFAAQILWLERDEPIPYRRGLHADSETMTLGSAVDDTFRRLSIAPAIEVKSDESITYQILFPLEGHKGKKRVTIADVGFGVSQLLPIVVMGLRSPLESLLLFEQPEIHLHPKLQATLADFLLTVALTGKRVLVETHSDHFINQLRRRIAEDEEDTLKDKISILFVTPPKHGEGAEILPLKVDRYGVIENWPPDFLPESSDLAQAIVSAGMKKRRAKK